MKNSLTNAWVTTKDVQRLINDGFAQGEMVQHTHKVICNERFEITPWLQRSKERESSVFRACQLCFVFLLFERVRGVIVCIVSFTHVVVRVCICTYVYMYICIYMCTCIDTRVVFMFAPDVCTRVTQKL